MSPSGPVNKQKVVVVVVVVAVVVVAEESLGARVSAYFLSFFFISLFKMRHAIFSLNEYVMLCYVHSSLTVRHG